MSNILFIHNCGVSPLHNSSILKGEILCLRTINFRFVIFFLSSLDGFWNNL